MALPQGIDFRASAGYVTDPANCDYSIVSRGDYPWTTAQGNNVGWEINTSTSLQDRNRNSSNDARIAGINYTTTGSNSDAFRIDLPSAGNYKIGAGFGDASYAQAVGWDLYDTNSNIGTLSTGSTSGANQFNDATDTEYSAAAWPGSQTLVSKTFSTTICRFKQTADSFIAHAYVESAAGQLAPVFLSPSRSSLIWR